MRFNLITFLNEDVAVNASEDHSEIASEGIYDTTLSVDDAMKALADRIGLSTENQGEGVRKRKRIQR